MKYLLKYLQATLLLLIPLVCVPFSTPAHAQGQIQLESIIEMEMDTVNGAGRKESYRVPVDTAEPGSNLVYTIRYKNAGSEQAVNAVITTPIPAKVLYQEGSAQGTGAIVTFSIDGGRTYHPPAQLFITDASGRQFPAFPKDYTHIRWTFENPLAPGARGVVSYRAILK